METNSGFEVFGEKRETLIPNDKTMTSQMHGQQKLGYSLFQKVWFSKDGII